MKMRSSEVRCVLAVAVSVLVTGCATFKPNPAVFSKQKFALVSFYGPKQIQAATGVIGGLQGMAEMGVEVMDAENAGWTKQVNDAIGGEWIPADKVAGAASYASLDGARFEQFQVTPKGLRAIGTSKENDPILGKVATELGVDAVVVVRHQWIIVEDARSGVQHASDGFELLIVGSDGQRLWYTDENVDGPAASLSGGQILAEMVGALKPDAVKEMTRNAVMLAHANFARTWSSTKANPPAAVAK